MQFFRLVYKLFVTIHSLTFVDRLKKMTADLETYCRHQNLLLPMEEVANICPR